MLLDSTSTAAFARAKALDVDAHVGRRLYQRRRMLGLTQKEVGALCGVRHQQIQKYECGDCTLSAPRLWQISQALGVPTDYFFAGLTQPEAKP